MSGALNVTGAVTAPVAITPDVLAASYTPVTVTIGSGSTAETYVGASVYSLISSAGFLYPPAAKNGFLEDYIAVTGANGAQVVLSEGEIDPNFGGKSSTDIIAYSENGVAIAPTLIVPGDIDGGIGGRDISGVSNLAVGIAALPGALPGTPAAPPLTLSGDLTPPSNPYTVATVEQLGATVQTDSFLSGATPTTTTFTGASLSSVLNSAGVNPSQALNDYVVATGSDGYGVVYSEGEINPAVRASPTALVAYNDGSGSFPSVGKVTDALRTTAPGDSKGGRYVSNLDSISVATPSNDAVLRVYEGALGRAADASGSAFWSGLLDDGTTLAQVAQGILQSSEFIAEGGNSLSNAGFVAQLYQNEMGRSADASGASFWTGLLDGGASRAVVLAGFSSTAEAVVHNAAVAGAAIHPTA
jgi:hypothetical protein